MHKFMENMYYKDIMNGFQPLFVPKYTTFSYSCPQTLWSILVCMCVCVVYEKLEY